MEAEHYFPDCSHFIYDASYLMKDGTFAFIRLWNNVSKLSRKVYLPTWSSVT